MTPYTKKIVELHKIHKAIEDKDCCNGGGNTPSGDITIDDVVKFMHDEINNELYFPYIKYNDIPELPRGSEIDIDSMRGKIYRTSAFSYLTNYNNEFTCLFNARRYIIVGINMGTVG